MISPSSVSAVTDTLAQLLQPRVKWNGIEQYGYGIQTRGTGADTTHVHSGGVAGFATYHEIRRRSFPCRATEKMCAAGQFALNGRLEDQASESRLGVSDPWPAIPDAGECPPFAVLLGPDYAGKSSVMAELRATVPDWHLVSVDAPFVPAEHAVLSQLKRVLVHDSLGTAFSADFTLSLAQTAVVYLRDRILAADGRTPVVIDSYYYKILAKCQLVGADEHPMFTWWRSFPQPRHVLYLEVAPDVAWTRSAASVNRLEHYGDDPNRDAFESFQSDLHKLMLDEVRHLPVTRLPERGDIAETAREVRKVLSGDRS